MELLIMKFYPLSCYLVPLRPKYSPPKTLFPNNLSLRSSLNVNDQVSHPYITTDKCIVNVKYGNPKQVLTTTIPVC
jgi:hypothetical protein